MKRLYLLTLLLLYSGFTSAESLYNDHGFYLGGKLGATLIDIENKASDDNNQPDKDPSTASMGVLLGYNINHFFAVESDVNYLGKLQRGPDSGNLMVFSTYLVGRYYLSDRAAVYAKIGNSFMDNDLNLSGGIGLKYQISSKWELDTGYRLIGDVPNVEDDLYEFSVGLNYKFGVTQKSDKVVAPPASVIVPITINSSTLFKFDSAEIRDPSALAKLAKKMRMSQEAISVDIVAYTDNSGPAAYNLKLSKKRALAVRDYFISQGVHEEAINTGWKGEDNPIASNKSRAGRIKNRRVEVIYINNDVVYQ
ncbi:OmpA family protein [Psychromonas sp. Urea-02u-13]|uniref:OmpA family protein n=1 Tax=Psychromonas sp. Urea-02u-13 TaxID=2058326 RepID=UPI000C334EE6|nr:OmpA family protein [Psychromonas sp. Urea-02u-13]PKG40494.1 flagellar motor protein MotB [Psychromonas sp. Urea-02u-13]